MKDYFGELELIERRNGAEAQLEALAAEAHVDLARRVRKQQRAALRGDEAGGSARNRGSSGKRERSTLHLTSDHSTAVAIVEPPEAGQYLETGSVDPVNRRIAARIEAVLERCAIGAENCLARADEVGPFSPFRDVELRAAVKLANAAANIAATIARLRGGNTMQTMRIEKITIEPGARAVLGNVAGDEGRG